jgi:type VI secretion system protein ImpE
MTAQELLDACELSKCLEAIGAEVRSQPGDMERRTFLFEVLAFSGDLDRAAKQLEVIAQQGADSALAVQKYQDALKGEAARREVFSGNRLPGLPKLIPDYTGLHLKALHSIQEGKGSEALALLEEATESYPSLRGEINGRPFEGISDCDDLLGPYLEVLVAANYSWIPWESIESVEVAAPKYLRDLVWIPASVSLKFGPLGQVLLPCLYPGSYQSPNDQIKLGKVTDWRTDVEGLALGLGQKLLAVDDQEVAITEIRAITFEDEAQSKEAGVDA